MWPAFPEHFKRMKKKKKKKKKTKKKGKKRRRKRGGRKLNVSDNNVKRKRVVVF